MDVNLNASASLLSTVVSVNILKKSMDLQGQGVLELINGIPLPVQPGNLPPNLGQNIDTTA